LPGIAETLQLLHFAHFLTLFKGPPLAEPFYPHPFLGDSGWGSYANTARNLDSERLLAENQKWQQIRITNLENKKKKDEEMWQNKSAHRVC